MIVKCPECLQEFEEYPGDEDTLVEYEDSEQRIVRCPHCHARVWTYDEFAEGVEEVPHGA